MFLFQIFYCFQFNDNGIFDKHISNIVSNFFSFIIDIYCFLAFTLNSTPF